MPQTSGTIEKKARVAIPAKDETIYSKSENTARMPPHIEGVTGIFERVSLLDQTIYRDMGIIKKPCE